MNTMSRKRVLVARFFHETHTFVDEPTGCDLFRFREGSELLESLGDSSPLGGVLEYAQEQRWEVIPTVDAHAFPSGTIEHTVFELFWNRFVALATDPLAQGIDAIYLVLHGACVTDQLEDVEGEFLSRIRNLPNAASIPIYGVYDLHANVSKAMVELSQCLIAYRENPHTDARQAAVRAAQWLSHYFHTGVLPNHYWQPTPIVWPPTGTGTANNPMKRLLEMAREIESSDPNVLAVNVNAGFGFSDVRDVGLSFSLVAESSADSVQPYLSQLADAALESADQGLGQDEAPHVVMQRLCDLDSTSALDGLTVLVEPSENIGGSAPGDGVALLRLLLDHPFHGVLACIADPEFVQSLLHQPVGGKYVRSLGAKKNRISGLPIEGEFELVGVHPNGRFELRDKRSHLASAVGDFFDMGPCVSVRLSNATILVTTIKTPPMDLGQYLHIGLDPSNFRIVVVKAAVAHRGAYDPIAARQYWVDTPGPCSSNLRSFAYRRIRRPVYPLDSLEAVRSSLSRRPHPRNDWWQIENADDIPTPTLLLYPDRIDSNLDKMIAWTQDVTRLRPHVKTHKLPEIIAMKRAKGIDKFKTSTIAESEMVAMAGGRDVLQAMQPVGYNFHRLLQLVDKYPKTQFSALVDDPLHLQWMHSEAKKQSKTIRLFVDINVGMNRTGIAVGEGANALYRQLCQLSAQPHPSITVGGLHAYDGHLHTPDDAALVSMATQAFDKVWAFRDALQHQGFEVPKVVASGTPTSPILGSLADGSVEISAGTTVLWDFGQQDMCPNMSFLNAAVLLMRVVSRPTANRLCIDLGHKAVASEFPQPRVRILGLEEAQFVMHSEEHLVVETPRSQEYPVGTILYGIPRHICPTVALHSHVWSVRDHRAVEAWRVTARDRILTI